jgi:hypothetical protein
LGAGALFWAVFPLWLSVFWSVQGYPPTLSDLPRWYGVGAFNAAPIVGMVLASPLVLGVVALAIRRRDADATGAFRVIVFGIRRRDADATPKRSRSVGVSPTILGTFLYALLAPPIAYALLLIYADMWQYRAWDVMMPTLLRAYLLLAPACGVVGAVVGWSLKK